MTAEERLQTIRAKIQRANEHIRELNVEVRAFLDTPPQPYVVDTKRDPESRELIYYVATAAERVPSKIALIVGDVVENLRSALDYLAYQLVLVGSPGIEPGRNVYFPISENATRYESETPGKVKGMRKDAIKAIKALKPYRGGNDLLWILHRLNNINKHRAVITVGAAFVGRSILPIEREELRAALARRGRPELDRAGRLFLARRPSSQMPAEGRRRNPQGSSRRGSGEGYAVSHRGSLRGAEDSPMHHAHTNPPQNVELYRRHYCRLEGVS